MAKRRARKGKTLGRHISPALGSVGPAKWLLPLILVATALVFSPALGFQFSWDDRVQVANNPAITSWSNLPLYFTSHVWGFTNVWTSYYRPLFLTTLRAVNEFVGLDPVGWHAFPILVHLLNICLGFVLARKLTRDTITALIAISLFAIHPVQIESVGWISGMTDPLMAVSLFAAFICYLRWKETNSTRWLAFCFALFTTGLLTKESAIVFPLVLAVYELLLFRASGEESLLAPQTLQDACHPERSEGSRQRSPHSKHAGAFPPLAPLFAPLLLITAAYLFLRHHILGSFLGSTAVDIPWSTVLLTAPLTLLRFLRFLFLPYGMSAFYDAPYITRPDLLHFVLPTLALILIATALWYWSRRTRQPLIVFAAMWALLAIAPVLNIRVMQEGDFVHLRFLYIPCFAVALTVSILLRQIWDAPPFSSLGVRGTSKTVGTRPFPSVERAGILTALALCCGLALATGSQIGHWRNNEAMYKRGIQIAPDNRVPKNNLADDYIHAERIDEASVLLDDVLRRHPDFWMANYNAGYIAYLRQDWPRVADYMQRSIANRGEQVDAYVYRAYALLKLNRPVEAEQSVRDAIVLRPNARSYHFVLGLTLRQQQRWPEALAAFEDELKINPQDTGAAQHVADLKARLAKH